MNRAEKNSFLLLHFLFLFNILNTKNLPKSTKKYLSTAILTLKT